jgi:hypothetical protein
LVAGRVAVSSSRSRRPTARPAAPES